MLYASSRNALTRSLGSAHFPDALFATSKADLTLDAYKAHKAHNAAPQPLSAREQELADARAMERAAGSSYEGTRGRLSHVGDGFGLAWTAEVEDAVRTFGKASRDAIILLVRTKRLVHYFDKTSNLHLLVGRSEKRNSYSPIFIRL